MDERLGIQKGKLRRNGSVIAPVSTARTYHALASWNRGCRSQGTKAPSWTGPKSRHPRFQRPYTGLVPRILGDHAACGHRLQDLHDAGWRYRPHEAVDRARLWHPARADRRLVRGDGVPANRGREGPGWARRPRCRRRRSRQPAINSTSAAGGSSLAIPKAPSILTPHYVSCGSGARLAL